MKKKIFTLALAVMMIAATLVGCGGDTTKDDTKKPSTEVTTETPSTDVVEDTSTVDVPDTTVENTETNGWEPFGTYVFPEGMDGFTEKYVSTSDENWSINGTHYVDVNGNEMNFEWEGSTELGSMALVNGKTLTLTNNNDNYGLYAWGSKLDSLDEAIKFYDKQTIVTVSKNFIHKDGDYYKLYDEETYDKVIFKVTSTINGIEYTGYACYMDNFETMTTYQFVYVEKNDIFDENRAMKVVESIKYWDYNPTN